MAQGISTTEVRIAIALIQLVLWHFQIYVLLGLLIHDNRYQFSTNKS